MKTCVMEMAFDPRCIDFGAKDARRFVVDDCFPIFYQALADAKSRALALEPVLTDQMRGGEAGISCSGDSHGNVSCEGHATIRW